MSFNSKRVRKAQARAQFKRASGSGGKSDTQLTGNVGPAKTAKKNTKKNTWFAKLAGMPVAPAKPMQEEASAE